MRDEGFRGDAVGCFPGGLENWGFGRVSGVWGRWMIEEPKGEEDWEGAPDGYGGNVSSEEMEGWGVWR